MDEETKFLLLLSRVQPHEWEEVIEELRLIAECGQCERRRSCDMYGVTVDTVQPSR